ncbi:hypothetical protein AwErysi_05870 [Erysipelotrichaceae bacterium]|nr:hypothetical protein AwErysi_05870 [Erysipelotrichaceae bacterium]
MENTVFLAFIYEFHVSRDYFECHEIGEELWGDTAGHPPSKDNCYVVLLQFAVALYHWRRGNSLGARSIMVDLPQNIISVRTQITALGIDLVAFEQLLESLCIKLSTGAAYYDVDIPMTPELAQACSKEFNIAIDNFSKPSDFANELLIDRHLYI